MGWPPDRIAFAHALPAPPPLQVGLITFLAHVGSFVPAESGELAGGGGAAR